jgi:transcriptional regulator with XRE-family HTH domain
MDMYDAEQIRAIRKALGKTQTEFAFAVGVSTSAVISWEAGIRHPTWKKMQRINELAKTLSKQDLAKAVKV